MDVSVKLSDKTIKIGYRYYGKVVEDTGNYTLACLQTRHHDGYVRQNSVETLLKWTVSHEIIAAHCLLSLCDYVLEISTAVVYESSNDLQEVMKDLINSNPDVFNYINAKCISYWNEYYRERYATYEEYPPYAFLSKLRNEANI